MIDKEKVIKGLEICRHRVISQENCKECPYIYDGRAKQSNCEGVLHWDALALLKEQGNKKTCCAECRNWDSESGLSARMCAEWGKYTTQKEFCSRAVKWE